MATGSITAIPYTYIHAHTTHSYIPIQRVTGSAICPTRADKERAERGGCVRANKKVRLDWNVSPTSICETLHCRGSWLLVAGPDKSLWSLMFVNDRGWVHRSLEARGHDIHLPAISSSNTVRVIASATHLQHVAKAHFTKLTCLSFTFLSCTMCLGNGSKVQSLILTLSAASMKNARNYSEGNSTTRCLDPMSQHLHTTTLTDCKVWSHMAKWHSQSTDHSFMVLLKRWSQVFIKPCFTITYRIKMDRY